MEFLKHIFSSGDFLPHGTCYLWNWRLILLHIISDSLIALAYMSIPITLVQIVRKRKDLPFNWMFLCFGMFIVACGLTHVMEVVVLWQPAYWLAGIVKAVTAVASLTTAVLLLRLVPQALAIPSPTDLIRANEALRRESDRAAHAESKSREMIEAAPDAIVVADSQGKIVLVNRQTELLFGYDSAQLLGQTVEMLMPARFRQAHPAHRANYASAPCPRPMGSGMTLRGLRRDGSEFPIEISLSPLETEEGLLVASAIRDVTERVKAQEDLRRLTEDLEATNRELEAFTYSVSHDLRAPLRHIDGFSRILMEDYGRQLPPECHRHLNRIHEATRHMGNLMDDLLNLSRIARQPLALQLTNLNTIVTTVKTDLAAEIASRQMEWHFAVLPTVECDPGLIKQVFFNLLANAVKFTRSKDLAQIEVGLAVNGSQPAIFIRDNGVGFNMKYSEKLFGVFQRLHRQEDFEGTGVGLAIVERILRKHGGRIWVEAQPGNGATFYFTLSSLTHSPVKTAEIMGAKT